MVKTIVEEIKENIKYCGNGTKMSFHCKLVFRHVFPFIYVTLFSHTVFFMSFFITFKKKATNN